MASVQKVQRARKNIASFYFLEFSTCSRFVARIGQNMYTGNVEFKKAGYN